MFPKLKEKLSGRRFDDVEEMEEAVTSVLDSLHLEAGPALASAGPGANF